MGATYYCPRGVHPQYNFAPTISPPLQVVVGELATGGEVVWGELVPGMKLSGMKYLGVKLLAINLSGGEVSYKIQVTLLLFKTESNKIGYLYL